MFRLNLCQRLFEKQFSHHTVGVKCLWCKGKENKSQTNPVWKCLSSHPLFVPLCEASPLLVIVSVGRLLFFFHFFLFVYLLLPWDLNSMQGLLFNGTVIKCAFCKPWCFVLSLFTHPYTSTPLLAHTSPLFPLCSISWSLRFKRPGSQTAAEGALQEKPRRATC